MANLLTHTDIYALVNDAAYQITGRKDLTAYDTSTFCSVCETLFRSGKENLLNELTTMVTKTIFKVRPYKARLISLMADSERWGYAMRKVYFLPMDLEESDAYNTNLDSGKLDDGESLDHYVINKPKAVQFNLYGTKVMQKHWSTFDDQLAQAFKGEDELAGFLSGCATEILNELESDFEACARMCVINHVAACVNMQNNANISNSPLVVDLAKEFNLKFDTEYTREELLTTYLSDFIKFFTSEIKKYSDHMQDRSAKWHFSPSGKAILTHTPKADQRLLLYDPIVTEAKAYVYSEIFNPQYLQIESYEGVNFWQSESAPTKITVSKCNAIDEDGESYDGAAVSIDYMLGMLYDKDAMGVNHQFDRAVTTPMNARGLYYNQYLHYRQNYWNDFCANAVIFLIGAGGDPTP